LKVVEMRNVKQWGVRYRVPCLATILSLLIFAALAPSPPAMCRVEQVDGQGRILASILVPESHPAVMRIRRVQGQPYAPLRSAGRESYYAAQWDAEVSRIYAKRELTLPAAATSRWSSNMLDPPSIVSLESNSSQFTAEDASGVKTPQDPITQATYRTPEISTAERKEWLERAEALARHDPALGAYSGAPGHEEVAAAEQWREYWDRRARQTNDKVRRIDEGRAKTKVLGNSFRLHEGPQGRQPVWLALLASIVGVSTWTASRACERRVVRRGRIARIALQSPQQVVIPAKYFHGASLIRQVLVCQLRPHHFVAGLRAVFRTSWLEASLLSAICIVWGISHWG